MSANDRLADTETSRPDQSGLGCSKCRYAKRGCKRCRDPAFRAKQQVKNQRSEPDLPAKKLRKHSESAQPAQEPKAVTRGNRQDSSTTATPSAAATQAEAGSENTVGNYPVRDSPSAVRKDSGAHPPLPERAAPPEAQQVALSHDPASEAQQATSPQVTALPGTISQAQQPSSQGTAPESRPSFLSMLQSKMEKQRQQQRERQSQSAAHTDGSLSDASLSSVHGASPAQPTSAPTGGPSGRMLMSPDAGTQAPEALAAPRHKIAMQKRRSAKQSTAKKKTAKKASKTRAFGQPGADPRKALWHPPASPYGLIEEYLYEDPWKLLVACMLLNVTAGKQVRKVLWKLFDIWPAAAVAAEAQPDTLSVVETLIQPLGLFRKRTMAIKRFSKEYLETEWVDPIQLHGIGQYASDAYFMFCRGMWREVTPTDKDLLKYQQWLHSTDGEGTGLERDTMPSPSSHGQAPEAAYQENNDNRV